MEMSKRPESTSWWRIIPATLWGGVAGAFSPEVVVNIPPGDPNYYWWVKGVHLVIGLVLGFLLYLLQRLFRLNKSNSAMVLSCLRTAGVVVILSLLMGGDSGGALVKGVFGIFLGIGFHTIDRIIAKRVSHKFGGDPARDSEATAEPAS